eukprot:m.40748 g.40748  ORF g.40748 m.40748 type:complete len:337 (+) comp9704_c0_seq1:129-1139(+)
MAWRWANRKGAILWKDTFKNTVLSNQKYQITVFSQPCIPVRLSSSSIAAATLRRARKPLLFAAGSFVLGGIYYVYQNTGSKPITPEANQSVRKAISDIKDGNLDEAEYTLRQAIEQHAGDSLSSETRLIMLAQLARVLQRKQNYQQALKTYREVAQGFVLQGRPVDDPAMIELSINIAKCLHSMGQIEEAEIGLNWCIKHQQVKLDGLLDKYQAPLMSSEEEAARSEYFDNNIALLGMALEASAEFSGSNSQHRKAAESYEVLARYCSYLSRGFKNIKMVEANNKAAAAYVEAGDLDNALVYAKVASEIATKHLDENRAAFHKKNLETIELMAAGK